VERIRAAIAAGVAVCFLGGDDDAVLSSATYKRIAEVLPEARLELVPGGPHSLYWEAPEVFNAALDRLLAAIPAW
jgi:pimeloyl-ACP methyl ester carboxylesterase